MLHNVLRNSFFSFMRHSSNTNQPNWKKNWIVPPKLNKAALKCSSTATNWRFSYISWHKIYDDRVEKIMRDACFYVRLSWLLCNFTRWIQFWKHTSLRLILKLSLAQNVYIHTKAQKNATFFVYFLATAYGGKYETIVLKQIVQKFMVLASLLGKLCIISLISESLALFGGVANWKSFKA